MLSFSKIPIKTIAIIALFLSVVLFNLSQPRPPSASQQSFDDWLRQIEEMERAKGVVPDGLSVSLVSGVSSLPFHWKISSNNPHEKRNVIRVLQLLREANLRELKEIPADAVPQSSAPLNSLSLMVNDSQKRFELTLPRDSFEKNLRLQTTAKLMQLAQVEKKILAKSGDSHGGKN